MKIKSSSDYTGREMTNILNNGLLLTNEPDHEGKLCHFSASLNQIVDLKAKNISIYKKVKDMEEK